jgi:hypothetical protein
VGPSAGAGHSKGVEQGRPAGRAHRRQGLEGIDAPPAPQGRFGGKASGHPLQKRRAGTLDPVGRAVAAPPQGFGQRQVEPEGEIGRQAGGWISARLRPRPWP